MSQSVDFDRASDRHESDSIKWRRYSDKDVIPMWIADMDFAAPDAVVEALQQRVAEGVYGYGVVPDGLVGSVCAWYQERYQWTIEPSWLVWLPGLVSGLHAVTKAFGGPGSGVMTHTPVYPPFLKVAERCGKRLDAVPMLFKPDVNLKKGACETGIDKEDKTWRLDFEQMQQAVQLDSRLLMFCNPHNPTGRVFRRDELEQVAHFCLKNNLLICSDEIHCDLVLEPGLQHIPMASLSAAIAQQSITLLAPSKTFNIAGLGCSIAVIPNRELRKQFKQSIQGLMPGVNILGYVAAEAAYKKGGDWLVQLQDYLRQNRGILADWVAEHKRLSMSVPEATYLGWIDFRDYGQELPAKWLLKEVGVALSEGADFGLPGFARINFGCPSEQLRQALDRLDQAL